MLRVNVLTAELDRVNDRDGFHWLAARGIADRLGGARIGASLFELPDGERTFPHHYHHGLEEWLYVLRGTPTLRDADGERTLAAGDTVCFPSGPDGVHSVRGPGRFLIFSTGGPPSISVYPDSGKLGTRPGSDPDLLADRLDFRRGDAVDYYDGE